MLLLVVVSVLLLVVGFQLIRGLFFRGGMGRGGWGPEGGPRGPHCGGPDGRGPGGPGGRGGGLGGPGMRA